MSGPYGAGPLGEENRKVFEQLGLDAETIGGGPGSGLRFPITEKAAEKLKELAKGKKAFIVADSGLITIE